MNIKQFVEKRNLHLSKEDLAILEEYANNNVIATETVTSMWNILDDAKDAAFVKKHHHFFEEYEETKTYTEKVKTVAVYLNEKGEISSVHYATTSQQRIELTGSLLSKLDVQSRHKVAFVGDWIEATFQVKTVSDDNLKIIPSKLDLKIRFETDDWDAVIDVINRRCAEKHEL